MPHSRFGSLFISGLAPRWQRNPRGRRRWHPGSVPFIPCSLPAPRCCWQERGTGSEPQWQRWPWGSPWERRGQECVGAVSHQLRAPPQHPGFTQVPLPLLPPAPTHAIPLALIKPLINRWEIWLRNATLERAGSAAVGITAISRFKEAGAKLISGPVFNRGNSCPGRSWSPAHSEQGPAKRSRARDERGLSGEQRERGERSRLSSQRAGKRLRAASSTDTMREGIFLADAATKAVKSSQVRGFRG